MTLTLMMLAAQDAPAQQSSRAPELPRTLLEFTYPTVSGKSHRVNSGDNLQRALNRAERGDEIVLAAGSRFTGNFEMPTKSGTVADGWIVVRSERLAELPAAGTRVTPAQASLMATVVTPNSGPALKTRGATSGWWLAGLEVTVASSFTGVQYGILSLGDGGSAQTTLASVASDLVLDRMYVHGQTTTNTQRCVGLNSARSQISDSYLDDCHAKGYDAQAIGGWNGPGPFKIVNNYLAGSGENIMFGGADPAIPNLTPADIEIRRNYIHTPLAWRNGYPNTTWTKKNLLELKNATRVLMEGNVFDGSWNDGQTGWALVMWSVNQSGSCRSCRTTDVTIRRNLIRNAGAGINLGGRWKNTDTIPSRFLITENVLDSIGVGVYGTNADRRGFQMSPSKSVEITRNILSGNLSTALMFDLTSTACAFRDNVWQAGAYGVMTSGMAPGTGSITKSCGADYQWSGMTLIGSSGGNRYPSRTVWAQGRVRTSLADGIRAAVAQATAGVAPP